MRYKKEAKAGDFRKRPVFWDDAEKVTTLWDRHGIVEVYRFPWLHGGGTAYAFFAHRGLSLAMKVSPCPTKDGFVRMVHRWVQEIAGEAT